MNISIYEGNINPTREDADTMDRIIITSYKFILFILKCSTYSYFFSLRYHNFISFDFHLSRVYITHSSSTVYHEALKSNVTSRHLDTLRNVLDRNRLIQMLIDEKKYSAALLLRVYGRLRRSALNIKTGRAPPIYIHKVRTPSNSQPMIMICVWLCMHVCVCVCLLALAE
ncbi:uncharacterized protein F4817DRAFT_290411 [Daldinia loculata]|uniref:uncharacterized protein n=1 Tax=Daldinia loculata TaxID=103429 RepID=UPI0020C36F03|nr:uncharacterized protein F4817DRAFT_290411 [Daldinia loculata]KAI1642648.1 hypothetical protein F4817DRAFT_290411 [Daldinia loculata]